MTQLHAYYHLRNHQAFQRLLNEATENSKLSSQNAPSNGLSSSGGRSWSKPSSLAAAMMCDVNARDWLGMTVLHYACASTEPIGLNFVRMLLAHPGINVNICDVESHWTPLHRALYNGNLPAALMLLRRQDIDTSVKDFEGYTAFDLYNSTVEHTKPDPNHRGAELYTWGTNRNVSLGQGDGNDRTFPDQVVIQPREIPSVELPLEARFAPINVREIQMSKLHTAIVTTESKGNLRLCGFGSGGRLGPGQQAQQYSLKPLHDFNSHTIVSVALGQDHTLALTSTGEVFSWGLNRFSQLGYVIEAPSGPDMSAFSRKDEPIQATPRKIPGSLKKAFVLGVAACKTASACWTSKEVFTWGTNNGQLGYDKAAQPVQVHPRVVTKLPFPAADIALSDNAMVCLLKMENGTCNVYYIHNDVCSKLSFPPHAFPAQIYPYRPPQSTSNADIQKVTCCEDQFAALSANGEVFMFSFAGVSDSSHPSSGRTTVKPQRIWALRKQFSAVKDVALGSDGSLIVCTESGHVYVRTRSTQTKATGGTQDRSVSSKPFKFQRIPYLQRVVRVCANSTGAFGALRVGFQPWKIGVRGPSMAQDLRCLLSCVGQPDYHVGGDGGNLVSQETHWPGGPKRRMTDESDAFGDGDNGEDDIAVIEDQAELRRLLEFIEARTTTPLNRGLSDQLPPPLSTFASHGADVYAQVRSSKEARVIPLVIPVHRVILAARSPPLLRLFSTADVLQSGDMAIRLGPLSPHGTLTSSSGRHTLQFEGCLSLSVLILLTYLYSDRVIAVWDNRVKAPMLSRFRDLATHSGRVKKDLRKLANLLELPHLAAVLESPVKRDPLPSLSSNLAALFASTQPAASSKGKELSSSPLAPDVLLKLKDRNVAAHSTVLRARSAFFASMFDEEDWTIKRWGENGVIEINLMHLEWRSMQFVLRFLCCGEDEEMVSVMNTIESPEELLGLMFDVMAAANELLLDRLVLICSSTILKFVNITNVCYTLSEATFFHSLPLVSSVQGYIAVNMESMLESRMLEDLSPDLVDQLARFVRAKQAEKLPVSRSNILIVDAMLKHKEWLDMQDIPTPIVVKNPRLIARKASAKLSPPVTTKLAPMTRTTSTASMIQPSNPSGSQAQTQADDIFTMDEVDELAAVVSSSPAVWKSSSVPRVDMKALMAEQERSGSKGPTTPVRRPVTLPGSTTGSPKSEHRTPQRDQRITPTSSPWGASNKRSPAGVSQPSLPSFPALGTLTPLTPAASAQSNKSKTNSRPASSSNVPQTQPGLGPVYAPTRQPQPPASTPRRVSASKAWTSPPAPPSPSNGQASGMSLVAIQQLELEQSRPPTKDKRSIVDIQREEEDRRVEEDFLRWWASEEQRIKLESDVSAAPPSKQSKRSAKKPKPARKGTSKAPQTAEAPAGPSN